MKVTVEDVLRVAELANLRLTEPEQKSLLHDLNSILDHIDALNEVDTTGVEPMAHAAATSLPMRDDATHAPLGREAALSNAPETNGTFFKVPKVIER